MWRPWTDGMVYIPYYINNQYSSREKAIITRGLESFSSFSCIRFRPSRSSDRDWISIESKGGCFSSIGRRGGGQVVSLARQGCLYHGTVQHELLHALGFNHEQTRSDRDQYIRVVLQNVQSGMEHNFRKKNTLNQGTSYDYNSVMQYHRYAFSKNNQPTMVPIPDANVSFGKATQMSRNDITRLNTLYKCYADVVHVPGLRPHVLCLFCAEGVRREKVPSLGMSVGELLERANRGRTLRPNGPVVVEGDIAIKTVSGRNADPCTAQGCLWKKWTDGLVYIPYYIANQYSPREKAIIIRGLESFSAVSCIRFRPTIQNDVEWLNIESESGCYSWVGRQGGKQVVSLARQGCLYHGTVQHELLHALGFNHEQTRSDRDKYIKVAWENIIDDQKYNFNKLNTLNQGTPYDYSSVMQYERYAFSKNNKPTMIPIPNPNVAFGGSQEMSKNDIIRINNLYKCCELWT
ncbi:astacin-like metalloendopeptidase [Gadus macrocephalus]|uniref:astacin-like metalloendopeptidase n=1 Tax=Gadus macrocephalus TaxID=80720 RepID=UPI0028CB6A3B|nr:astacin-like metalloendopeptidase [Gadus macrocephalus]